MNSPKVSVVIPAYNQAEFLGEAIQSVLDQTYTNIELIVVDDASPDDTAPVVRQFDDSRIKYLIHQQNRGLPATRNTGMRASSGELIALLDADDFFHLSKLEAHVNYLMANQEIGVTYNNRFELNYSKNTIRELYRAPQSLSLKDFVLGFPFAPSEMVIRREWAEKLDFFNERCVNGAEDLDFPIRLALSGCRFARVDRALNFRRHHSGRRRKNLKGRKEDWVYVLDNAFSDPRCPDDVKDLRTVAFSEHNLVLVFLAFAQQETSIGLEFLQDVLQLSPSIFEGRPCKFVRDLVAFSVADENQDHTILMRTIFNQIPPELEQLSEQYEWAVGRGYLLKGLRAIIWDRKEEGAIHFGKATEWNARIDKPLLHKLVYQIGAIEAEFGQEKVQLILRLLLPYLEKAGGVSTVRWLESTLSYNRAISYFQNGKFSKVPRNIGRTFTTYPRYLSNRGAWSILMRSMVNQMMVKRNY